MVSLSRPCVICRQFREEEIAFCLINNSTVCQNQASPTFPTVQASGMLGIKSWTELFSVWECLISCLKWEHFLFLSFAQNCTRDPYSHFLSIFWMILLQTMTPLGVNKSENTKCSLPVDLDICKNIRESIGKGFKKWERQFINSSYIFSWMPRKLNLFSPTENHSTFLLDKYNMCLMLICNQFTHYGENLVVRFFSHEKFCLSMSIDDLICGSIS